jgi:hypothetical protein
LGLIAHFSGIVHSFFVLYDLDEGHFIGLDLAGDAKDARKQQRSAHLLLLPAQPIPLTQARKLLLADDWFHLRKVQVLDCLKRVVVQLVVDPKNWTSG